MNLEMNADSPMTDRAVDEARVRDLVSGLVLALPMIALGKPDLPSARSRAEEFARALAARRAA